jgi:hypothetical protein
VDLPWKILVFSKEPHFRVSSLRGIMKAIQFTHLRSAMTRWGLFLLLPVGMIAVSAQCREKSDKASPRLRSG